MGETTPTSASNLNLSEALLAPLNAIFEAQVHAARSFLSFILQMGFRHHYTEVDIKTLESDPEGNKEILANIREENKAKERINALRQLKSEGKITENELNEFKRLVNAYDDIHSQDFTHIDEQGNENMVTIPNLALIPVKPLAIDTASFKFEMSVNQEYQNYNTMKKSANADYERPWFLIQPKRLTGSIVAKDSSASQAAISIEINIKSTEMPYGLNKLLTMMTESSRILPYEHKPGLPVQPIQPEKTDQPNQ